MFSSVTRLWTARVSARPKHTPTARGPSFRPRVEGFEDRVVPAAPTVLGPALAAPAAASPASLLPINITSATLDAVTGAVDAVGTIGNQAFNLIGQLTLAQSPTGATPILDLHLNAIHLDVLGLKVDTSDICLSISASSGPGQLLGNLLSGIAGGTLPATLQGALTGLAGNLTTTLDQLLGQVGTELTQLLNAGLGQLFSPTSVGGGSVTQGPGSTSILHLELGPVHLNLLGLNVDLDNCADGPVTVDISAQSGPGKLLGNLLTSVTHLLDGSGNGNGLTNALGRLANRIGDILNQAV